MVRDPSAEYKHTRWSRWSLLGHPSSSAPDFLGCIGSMHIYRSFSIKHKRAAPALDANRKTTQNGKASTMGAAQRKTRQCLKGTL